MHRSNFDGDEQRKWSNKCLNLSNLIADTRPLGLLDYYQDFTHKPQKMYLYDIAYTIIQG